MEHIHQGVVIYFSISLALLAVSVFYALRKGEQVSWIGMVIGFLFGPILLPLISLVVLVPLPSAYPVPLIYRTLDPRHGKTVTQILSEITVGGESVGGLWPSFSTQFYLGSMKREGYARCETVTIRDFSDRLEKMRVEDRQIEFEKILSPTEIHRGLVQIYFQGNPPGRDRGWLPSVLKILPV